MPAEAIFEPAARRDGREFAAKLNHLLASRGHITANFGAQLDDRLMHLRLDAFFQKHFAVGQNLLNVRAQLARLRIDDLKFLFDSEREDVIACAHSPVKLK